MSQLHVVIRPFESDRPLKAGEVVDVSTWRMARSLVERRYIRPATNAEIEAAAPVEAQPAPVLRGRIAGVSNGK